jgi:hypothetical protein
MNNQSDRYEGPIPEHIESLAREIAAQHPELVEAMMDYPAQRDILMLPPDACLLAKEYLETHPESTAEEIADALIAAHGEAWIANAEARNSFVVTSVLRAMRRMIGESEL